MCLISFSWQQSEQYPFVLVANRDEFFARPTQAMHFWHDQPDILAGRDLQAGGTWLGVHQAGRFAALTNVRNSKEFGREAKSRGLLVTDFLLSDVTPEQFLQQLHLNARDYNGFNLLVGDGQTLTFYSTVEQQITHLPPGIYGLSNATLDTPWPKVSSARQKLSDWLHLRSTPLIELLHDSEIVGDELLPDTGIPLEWERGLSAQFIRMSDYGTRCSTAITLDGEGLLTVEERIFSDQGKNDQQAFQIDGFWNR